MKKGDVMTGRSALLLTNDAIIFLAMLMCPLATQILAGNRVVVFSLFVV